MTKGFTVIELIIVIVIIGILAVMVIPRMMDTRTINARESAELVAADIRRTQELALSGISSQSVIFTSGNGYYIAGGRTVTLPSGVTIGTTTTITFNRQGVPSANPSFSVNVGGVLVTITQNTGRVTIS